MSPIAHDERLKLCERPLRRRESELWQPSTRFAIDTTRIWPIEVRRGFIHSITCTAADCIAHLDAIRKQHPVREVTLTTYPIIEQHISTSLLRADMVYVRLMLPDNQFTDAMGTTLEDAINKGLKTHVGWGDITFKLSQGRRMTEAEAIHGTGENLPMGTINAEEESDAAPARRESAAQRAREIEFTGRHRRRR